MGDCGCSTPDTAIRSAVTRRTVGSGVRVAEAVIEVQPSPLVVVISGEASFDSSPSRSRSTSSSPRSIWCTTCESSSRRSSARRSANRISARCRTTCAARRSPRKRSKRRAARRSASGPRCSTFRQAIDVFRTSKRQLGGTGLGLYTRSVSSLRAGGAACRERWRSISPLIDSSCALPHPLFASAHGGL